MAKFWPEKQQFSVFSTWGIWYYFFQRKCPSTMKNAQILLWTAIHVAWCAINNNYVGFHCNRWHFGCRAQPTTGGRGGQMKACSHNYAGFHLNLLSSRGRTQPTTGGRGGQMRTCSNKYVEFHCNLKHNYSNCVPLSEPMSVQTNVCPNQCPSRKTSVQTCNNKLVL